MPSTEVERLQTEIISCRHEQRAAQHQLEDAICCEARALSAVDASRAVQTRCRRLVEENAQAISSMQDEIAALLPKPRTEDATDG